MYPNQLPIGSCLSNHQERFGKDPDNLLADQLYANRDNRRLFDEKQIPHSFKRMGRPPNETSLEKQKYRREFKKKQGQHNHIEATFGHLKGHFNLTHSRQGGETMQIQLGLIASNLQKATAYA